MFHHRELTDEDIRRLIRAGAIRLAGSLRLKIFGCLDCPHGRRMKRENRVFFASEAAARRARFRPCGHCMRAAYRAWIEDEVAKPGIESSPVTGE